MKTCNCSKILHCQPMSPTSSCVSRKPVEVSWSSLCHYFVVRQLRFAGIPLMWRDPQRPAPFRHDLPRRPPHKTDKDLSLSVPPSLVLPLHGQAEILDTSGKDGAVKVGLWSPVTTVRPTNVEVFAEHHQVARQNGADTLASASQTDNLFGRKKVGDAAQHQLW